MLGRWVCKIFSSVLFICSCGWVHAVRWQVLAEHVRASVRLENPSLCCDTGLLNGPWWGGILAAVLGLSAFRDPNLLLLLGESVVGVSISQLGVVRRINGPRFAIGCRDWVLLGILSRPYPKGKVRRIFAFAEVRLLGLQEPS